MPRSHRSEPRGTALPELPPTLPSAPSDPPHLAGGGHLKQLLWEHAHFDHQKAEDVLIEQVISRGSSWQHTELPLLQCCDSRFEGDDFAGATLEKAYLRRVVFTGCRLLGTVVTDGDLEDIIFQRCTLDFCRIWTSRLASVRFEQCRLREASFDGANLSGARFADCDLTNADLRSVKLTRADLRGSTITGVQINPRNLTGTIIDPQQAVQLAALLGIVVRPVDDIAV